MSGDERGQAGEARETYSVAQIREAFARHSHEDDWGVPCFYETGLLASLRGEYDRAEVSP